MLFAVHVDIGVLIDLSPFWRRIATAVLVLLATSIEPLIKCRDVSALEVLDGRLGAVLRKDGFFDFLKLGELVKDFLVFLGNSVDPLCEDCLGQAMFFVDLRLDSTFLRLLHFEQLLTHLGPVVLRLFQLNNFAEFAAVSGGMLDE